MQFPIKRRSLLTGIGASMLGSSAALAGARSGTRRQLAFGAAAQARHILVDEGFRAAILRECDTITPELEFKWDFIEATAGEFYLRPADQIANFARASGKRLHGHALLWHKGMPPWVIQKLLESPDWAPVRNYFNQIMPRYNDVTDSWDVINEPLEVGERPDGLRRSALLKAFGPDYIARGFEEASRLAPKADLYLNEYGLLYNWPESAAKRAAALQLLEQLVAKGVPIHGLGIQGHLELAKMDAFDAVAVSSFASDVADLGLKIRVSELDVAEDRTELPAEMRDARVADAVARFLDTVIDNPALVGVTCWGLSDRYSWLPPYSANAGLNRGLPLDSDLREKPMMRVVCEALRRV